jgi:hypothetical protein
MAGEALWNVTPTIKARDVGIPAASACDSLKRRSRPRGPASSRGLAPCL